jgi:hypothetical protein
MLKGARILLLLNEYGHLGYNVLQLIYSIGYYSMFLEKSTGILYNKLEVI